MIIVTYSSAETALADKIHGKFVQFIWLNQEHLVFAPSELHTYHVQILSHFLDDQDIPYKWLNSQQLLIKDSRLNVLGGGRFSVEPAQRRLKLWGNSQAFGRFEEAGIAQRISETFHPWREFEVTVE